MGLLAHCMRVRACDQVVDLSSVVVAPMPGSVVSIAVRPGDFVEANAEVATVEAMKMQNVLRSPMSGVVSAVKVSPGDKIGVDEVMIEFETPDAEAAA